MFDLTLLPLWYQLTCIGLLGAIFGSFINVVAYRMHTNASLGGRSRCFSCGHTLRWYELMPVLSYTCLLGRCSACRARISVANLLVEVVLGSIFVVLYLLSGSLLEFGLLAALATLLTGVFLYDMAHMIIPNEFVLMVIGVSLALFMVGGDFALINIAWHGLSALLAFLSYASLWYFSSGRWIGFGDAKLALPLGFLLVPMGVFSMVVLSFWVGAAIALSLLLFQGMLSYIRQRAYTPKGVANYRRYFTMKSEIPFAPFLIIAFFLVYIFEVDVLTLLTHVFAL